MSEYLEVAPDQLLIGSNVRIDRQLDQEFVASIKEHGVLQPIVGYRDADDNIVVRYGSRRTVAATQVGLPTVPVVLVGGPDEADRIATQVAENQARTALTVTENVNAYQQLAAFGLSAATIARKTGSKRAQVDTALRVAGSPLAAAAADRYGWLTLEQAAGVAEFDSDSDAVTALVAAAKSGQFPHLIQRMRDDRAEAEQMEAARAELLAAGVPVIEHNDLSWPGQRLDMMNIPTEDHQDCDGHAAFLAWNFMDRRRVPRTVFVCVDAVANGHVAHDARRGEPEKGPMTDEQKAERRRVIALNRAWASATVVRREWITTLAGRKAAPDGAELFVLTALLRGDHEIKQGIEAHWPMLREALGVSSPEGTQAWVAGPQECAAIVDQLATASSKRVLVVLVAAVLTAWETRTGPHTWRNSSAQTERYLTQLETWGYSLSPVEQVARGDTIDDQEFGLAPNTTPDPAEGGADAVLTPASDDDWSPTPRSVQAPAS